MLKSLFVLFIGYVLFGFCEGETRVKCKGINEIFGKCQRKCQESCNTTVADFRCEDLPCQSGCVCKPGYLRLNEQSPCLPRCKCPQIRNTPRCRQVYIQRFPPIQPPLPPIRPPFIPIGPPFIPPRPPIPPPVIPPFPPVRPFPPVGPFPPVRPPFPPIGPFPPGPIVRPPPIIRF